MNTGGRRLFHISVICVEKQCGDGVEKGRPLDKIQDNVEMVGKKGAL